jgi:hypothetical protein
VSPPRRRIESKPADRLPRLKVENISRQWLAWIIADLKLSGVIEYDFEGVVGTIRMVFCRVIHKG